MSGSGLTTLAVLLVGGACCWFSISGGARGDRPPDFGAPGDDPAIRSMHGRAAWQLRREGDVEAAEWHERVAEGKPAIDVAASPAGGAAVAPAAAAPAAKVTAHATAASLISAATPGAASGGRGITDHR